MLNSLHCLLLFWEAQESRLLTRQREQNTLDKSCQNKFNGWKSCFLKERKRERKSIICFVIRFIHEPLGKDDRRNPIPRIDINKLVD